ncbi:MAG: carotenoid biosynthesis protein [Promethearchaeota archaeon]|nr:MAG: carotenoid biosynthesis protein [Candidatus Lokiarchaeota archaeon]
MIGIISGHHFYAEEAVMFFGVVPLSIPLAWVGIVYSAMIIAERLYIKRKQYYLLHL